ncbi:MAG: DUF1818 family protein [Prochlorotrichaceae cyanobacterium]
MSDPIATVDIAPLQRGEGWRLGWDPLRGTFPALVGTEDWALELTQAEFEDFCRLSQQLASTLGAMAAELMDEERICCEVESDRVWVEAEGFPQHYELRLMLLTGRRGEGQWSAIAVPPFLQALQTLAAQLL